MFNIEKYNISDSNRVGAFNAFNSKFSSNFAIKNVVVLKRSGHDINMQDGRDHWWHDIIDGQASECEPEWVEAEHPLFLLYTSGSTGKPKGIQHSTAGFLLNAFYQGADGVLVSG